MKIPAPSTAKKMTLAGQKRLAEEEELRAKLAAENDARQKRIDKNWKAQSKKIIDIAIAQSDSIDLSYIVAPKKLIKMGLEIEEIGDISGHYYEELPRSHIIQELQDLIPKFSSQAPESSLRIWRYWEDIDEELKDELEKFINKSKSKYEPGDLQCQLSRNANFKRLPLARFESLLNEIQIAAEKVKTVMLISNWRRFAFCEVESLLAQVSEGKYFFSSTDLLDEELSPLKPSNKFRVSWNNGLYSHFDKPRNVISANGLAWLRSDSGQRLCESLGQRIQQVADQGNALLELNFEAEMLNDEDGFVGVCPSEEYFVELISLLGYSCKLKKEPNHITSMSISW